MVVQYCTCAYVLSRFSHVRFCDPMDGSLPQSPLSIGFSRQEYWSGLPCPPPRDLPDPGIEPRSPALVGGFFTWEILIPAYQDLINDSDYYCLEDLQCKPFMDQ